MLKEIVRPQVKWGVEIAAVVVVVMAVVTVVVVVVAVVAVDMEEGREEDILEVEVEVHVVEEEVHPVLAPEVGRDVEVHRDLEVLAVPHHQRTPRLKNRHVTPEAEADPNPILQDDHDLAPNPVPDPHRRINKVSWLDKKLLEVIYSNDNGTMCGVNLDWFITGNKYVWSR